MTKKTCFEPFFCSQVGKNILHVRPYNMLLLKKRLTRASPGYLGQDSTAYSIDVTDASEHPNEAIPKSIVGTIQAVTSCADHPNPIKPKTLVTAAGIKRISRYSGSKKPSERLDTARMTMSDNFPPTIVPSMQPIRGEMYKRPTCKGLKRYACLLENRYETDSDKTTIHPVDDAKARVDQRSEG